MADNDTVFRKLDPEDWEQVRDLFAGVFCAPPWNDDWSDREQLNAYIRDLTAQSNSLSFGLYREGELAGVSMGYIRHWFRGTEYCIDELFIRGDLQGQGLGGLFLQKIEEAVREAGMKAIFLQTENTVPAYDFYRKNGYRELKEHVSFHKDL